MYRDDNEKQPGVLLTRMPGEEIVIRLDEPDAKSVVVGYECGARSHGYLEISVDGGEIVRKRLQVKADEIALRPPGSSKQGFAPVQVSIDKIQDNRASIRVVAPEEFLILRAELVKRAVELDFTDDDDDDDFDDDFEEDDDYEDDL
jgi:hypothetical protein